LDGVVVDTEVAASPFEDPEGPAIQVILRDITDRKQAERALREGEARFSALFDQNVVGVAQVETATGRFVRLNQRLCDLLGYTRQEMLAMDYQSLTHPEDVHRSHENVRQFIAGGISQLQMEKRYVRKDGTTLWASLTMLPLWKAGQPPDYHVAVVQDITDRKRAEEVLSASEAKLHAIIDRSPVAMAVNDEQDNITFLNRRFVEVFGYTLEDIPTVAAWWPVAYPDPAYRQRCIQDWQAATEKAHREGTALQMEDYQVTCKDGSFRDIRFSLAPIGTENVVILYDMTERNQMEERLRQSQKLEGIGQLAGGMAHEFNNILAAMLMNINLAEMLTLGTEVREHLHEMQALCQRSADLVKQLLAFSRRSVMRIQPIDLTATVSQQCKMLSRLLGEGIAVKFSSPDGLSWVNADKAMIEQVLLNLCLNARDATRRGGLIQLGLAEAEIGPEQAKAHPEAQAGRFVCLSVTDTGCGMDELTMKRLFEPFFTTKPVGQGTGLGLAMVGGVIQQHHGWVEVESCVRKGSTFRVYLPTVAQPLAAPPIPKRETLAHGNGTILLVEDEPAVRSVTRLLLVRMGYLVLEATNGLEALAIWARHRATIDLIYTDMVMPGDLTGLQMVEQMLADKPGVKAIITSGYNTDLLDLGKTGETSIVYLPKSCPATTITSAIQKCLQRR
jgi:PAS domain S-box-containing protein